MFLDLIRKRRSVRKFQDKPIEAEKRELVIEAALRSPTSKGQNPWEFLVIDDKNLLGQLAKSKPHGSSFLCNATLAIIVIAQDSADTWVEDCSIAATYIQLAAESLELKSCWIQIRNRSHNEEITAKDFISGLTGIPKDSHIEAIIALGYPDVEKTPHEKESLQYEKVKYNDYNNLYK